MAAIIDLTPDEMASIIEERAALKAALQKATAAFLYADAVREDGSFGWSELPDEAFSVPESSPGACDGGLCSGRATYLAQASDVEDWMKYWEVA